jgi:hypothetical protein
MSFEEIWFKIEKYAGETFRTKDGQEFTYTVQGDIFISDEPEQTISKNDFKKAYQSPDVDPGEMVKIVKGPAFVWSVLHDKRIA